MKIFKYGRHLPCLISKLACCDSTNMLSSTDLLSSSLAPPTVAELGHFLWVMDTVSSRTVVQALSSSAVACVVWSVFLNV